MALAEDLVLSQADARPMYLQIFEQVRQRIAAGDWPPGQEIPSIRQLAVALSVSVITVKRAYLELERAGQIVTQQGKGSSVAESPPADPENDSSPPARLAEHLAEAARLGALLGLSPGELAERLRRAAEAFHSEKDRELP